MCPGWTRSFGTAVRDDMISIVRARSAALMPVVMPRAASTLTWKSVLKVSRFCVTMRSTPSCLRRSPVVGTQMSNLAFEQAVAPAKQRDEHKFDHVVLTDTLELENLDYSEFEASFDSMTLALASHFGALAPYRER